MQRQEILLSLPLLSMDNLPLNLVASLRPLSDGPGGLPAACSLCPDTSLSIQGTLASKPVRLSHYVVSLDWLSST